MALFAYAASVGCVFARFVAAIAFAASGICVESVVSAELVASAAFAISAASVASAVCAASLASAAALESDALLGCLLVSAASVVSADFDGMLGEKDVFSLAVLGLAGPHIPAV